MKYLTEYYFSNVKYPLEKQFIDKDFNWVYVIGNPITKLVKVGMTSSITKREQQIKAGTGVDVVTIFCLQTEGGCDAAATVIERQLLTFFKDKRVNGDWFSLNIRDLIQIRWLFRDIEGNEVQDNLSDYYHFF